ncbi:hypothetical protein MSAS_00490 [Mycobacterium saskatchewanense]|uniref:Nitronate monooxygenase domain-containing protein n=1 Tax=Mycobacterium saskatchewanense TaxID=220927 RepID=A0AAJ3NMR3_9MYCO|nr:hypothetical protein AWC23_21410 [Mycobacterium saskatchewanense]BBX60875.1 hypothetical protein MSAS_00490 [Mycobacterium saskatchewanense]
MGNEDGLDPPACDGLAAAIAADDPRIAPVDAGQGVGVVADGSPVAAVIAQICTGAEELLARWGR